MDRHTLTAMPVDSSLVDRLNAARSAAGHTQDQCGRILVSSFGAPDRSQASMSRYLAGKQAMPVDISRAVSDYIDTFDPDPEDAPAKDLSGAQAPSDFDGMVRRLTDEPLLGPRQAAVVDAAIDRLRSGPPMSPEDHAALTLLTRILGIDR